MNAAVYVLSADGARQLAEMVDEGDCIACSPGFFSRLRSGAEAAARLSELVQIIETKKASE